MTMLIAPVGSGAMSTDARPEVTVRVTLRWRDMDMLGHLNQSVYHELLEEGRTALISALGREKRFPFVLARVELDHLHEVRHRDGHVEVRTFVERVGGKSVTVLHEITLPDGTACASGRSILVAWDVESRGARWLTDEERAALGG
jgi:acyl-CoA thioester hydrolase